MLRVGIIGHRALGDPDTVRFVAEQCTTILQWAASTGGDVVALSATAEGADTLFAEAAVSVGVPLEIVRPFDAYATDFEDAEPRSRYDAVRRAAREETRLAYRDRSEDAYHAAMVWVTDRADLVIAAWDGLVAVGRGGTGPAFHRARATGRPVIHLDVLDRRVRLHGSGPLVP